MLTFIVAATVSFSDSLIVAKFIGSDEFAAVSISFPVALMINGVGLLFARGTASLQSQSIGEGQTSKIKGLFANQLACSFFFSLVVCLICTFFSKEILSFLGIKDLQLLEPSSQYLKLIIWSNFVLNQNLSFSSLMRSIGYMGPVLKISFIIAILNITFDLVFILVFNLDLLGAGLASLLSSLLGFLLFLTVAKMELASKIAWPRFDYGISKKISVIGLSSFLVQVLAMTQQAIIYRSASGLEELDYTLALFGAVLQIQSFIFMPLWGLAIGLQAIVASNYGAKQYKRALNSLYFFVGVITILSFMLFALIYLGAPLIVDTYLPSIDNSLVQIYGKHLIVSLCGVTCFGLLLPLLVYLQALGKGNAATIVTLCRFIFFFIPLALYLPKQLGIQGLALSICLTEFLSLALCLVLSKRLLKLE